MKEALQTEVFCSLNKYNRTLCIESKEWDYDKQHVLLCDFFKREGLGPFPHISLLTIVGRSIEESTGSMKLKK